MGKRLCLVPISRRLDLLLCGRLAVVRLDALVNGLPRGRQHSLGAGEWEDRREPTPVKGRERAPVPHHQAVLVVCYAPDCVWGVLLGTAQVLHHIRTRPDEPVHDKYVAEILGKGVRSPSLPSLSVLHGAAVCCRVHRMRLPESH